MPDTPVAITVLETAGRFSLRIAQADLAAADEAFGTPIPRTIGGRTGAGLREALCLGPDEWVLTTSAEDSSTLEAAFAALTVPHSLTDIGAREVAIRLDGDGAADCLAMGCPIDLATLKDGAGKRTVFDGVQIVLRRDGPSTFHVDVWRSYAPHVLALFARFNTERAAGL